MSKPSMNQPYSEAVDPEPRCACLDRTGGGRGWWRRSSNSFALLLLRNGNRLMITLLRGDSPGPQFFVSADPKDWIHGKSVDGTSLTPPRCLRSGNKTRRCPQPLTLGFAGAPIP